MAINSIKNSISSTNRKPYPKLITNGLGDVYMAYGKTKAVCVYTTGVPISEAHFYDSNAYDFEFGEYKDYEGTIILSNK